MLFIFCGINFIYYDVLSNLASDTNDSIYIPTFPMGIVITYRSAAVCLTKASYRTGGFAFTRSHTLARSGLHIIANEITVIHFRQWTIVCKRSTSLWVIGEWLRLLLESDKGVYHHNPLNHNTLTYPVVEEKR